jgi:hypothetical protein
MKEDSPTMTANFWRVLDRLGADGVAVSDWRFHLGSQWESARPFLRKAHRLADTVINTEHPTRRLLVEPEGDDGFVGIADESGVLHAPVPLSRDDIEVLAPDWEAITFALAQEFDFAGNRWERSGHIRKIGVSQHGSDVARPVILCLPPSHLMRHLVVMNELALRRDSTVLMPSLTRQPPEIDALAATNGLTLVGIAEHYETSAVRETPLPYLATPALRTNTSTKRRPVFRVLAGWTWEMLTIEVSTAGRLIFCCDGQRRDVRLPKSKGANHSESYEILFKLAFANPQEWHAPATWEKASDTVRRRFGRLRNQLQALIEMPGDPFHKIRDRVYTPRFRLIPHPNLSVLAHETRARTGVKSDQ